MLASRGPRLYFTANQLLVILCFHVLSDLLPLYYIYCHYIYPCRYLSSKFLTWPHQHRNFNQKGNGFGSRDACVICFLGEQRQRCGKTLLKKNSRACKERVKTKHRPDRFPTPYISRQKRVIQRNKMAIPTSQILTVSGNWCRDVCLPQE